MSSAARRECRGCQGVAVDRAAQRDDAADLVDRGADHREVQPVLAADIAVEHLPDVQAQIGVGQGQALRGALAR